MAYIDISLRKLLRVYPEAAGHADGGIVAPATQRLCEVRAMAALALGAWQRCCRILKFR